MVERREQGPALIRRFGAYRIAEHWAAILLFVALAVTGLSQRFFGLDISQWVILQLGGIDVVRHIHRIAGVGFWILIASHVLVVGVGLLALGWQPSMVITKKDITDARHNIRYYVGLEDHPAWCGRFNYKEKFVYWLVVTGGVVMALTGVALWFPVQVVKYLPGQIIPAAKVMHSNEGMLIFMLLAVWHIYDSIFSPDVFPLDTSIFSGYISRERMVREHPLELAFMEGVSVNAVLGISPAGGDKETGQTASTGEGGGSVPPCP